MREGEYVSCPPYLPVYDADRRQTQSLHHNGNGAATLNAATKTTYDLVGRVTKEESGTAFSGSTVTTWLTMKQNTYTPTSKLATVTDADSRVVTTAYDALDRPDIVTDPVGRKVHFAYDAAGNTLVEYRGWLSALQEAYATYTYTNNGKQASVYDADGSTHITTFAYDGFDRLLTTTFPDSTYEQLSYDENGNVLTKRNRSAQTLTYTYDNLDRMATKVMPASPSNITTTWVYDLAGRIDTLSDSAGNTLDYGFDSAKRVTSVATTIPGLTGAKTIDYQYDDSGNRTQLNWPGTGTVNYTYDSLNRMLTATSSGVTLGTYTYNALSRRTNLAYNNSGGATVAYTYSNAGDLLTIAHDLTSTANDNTHTYTYTNAHQSASLATSNSAWQWAPTTNGTDTYATVNTLNQYPTVNGTSLTYDTRGNLTGDGTWTYTYDAENRLLTANKTAGGTVAATYAYDPLGRRTKKSGTGVTTTYFINDGSEEIAEYNSGGTVTVRYVPGPGTDQPIVMAVGVTFTYFHTDKLGSVIEMSSNSGAKTEGPFTYDPYGNMTGTTSGVPFRYTGRRYDPESGLYYYRARYYSSVLGRFLQTDPTGYKDDLNLYGYVANDPIGDSDPTGTAGQGTISDDAWKKVVQPRQDKALVDVRSALKLLKGLKEEQRQLAAGKISALSSVAQATASAVKAMWGSSSASTLTTAIGMYSKVEAVLADKGGRYNYSFSTRAQMAKDNVNPAAVAYQVQGSSLISITGSYFKEPQWHQEGTLIHEPTHMFGTNDLAYRIMSDQALGSAGLNNADSYAAFIVGH